MRIPPLLGLGMLILASWSFVFAGSPDGGLARRGDLGAAWTIGDQSQPGARIVQLRSTGAAALAGLKVGDRVIAANGRALDGADAVEQALRRPPAGRPLRLDVLRGSEKLAVTIEPPEVPRETYAKADVIYASAVDARGQKVRVIVTRPKGATGRSPAIFVATWLSDDSVEAPTDDTRDGSKRVLRHLAASGEYVVMRVDKPGVGDSEGVCAETDFETELSGYRAAFRNLREFDFVDPERIFVLGMSNGGGYAPLVADGAPVRGYVVEGGWCKTWFEHMLEIERRRFTLMGRSPAEVSRAMAAVAELHGDYLLHGRTPAGIFAAKPHLREFWTDDTPATQYGRPPAFYQQLQRLNLAEAWSQVRVPTLALHGEFDWIMSREDMELIAALVNRNSPGAGEFRALPGRGHDFPNFTSMTDAFAWKAAPFDPAILAELKDWFDRHR
ncbi:MAG: hypothetical protein C0502_08860 [Opitutus sp.]|nr:hypothetical protein [Opitutus sp.]